MVALCKLCDFMDFEKGLRATIRFDLGDSYKLRRCIEVAKSFV